MGKITSDLPYFFSIIEWCTGATLPWSNLFLFIYQKKFILIHGLEVEKCADLILKSER